MRQPASKAIAFESSEGVAGRLYELWGNARRDAPEVFRRLRRAGVSRPRPRVVLLIAMYLQALNKLADE